MRREKKGQVREKGVESEEIIEKKWEKRESEMKTESGGKKVMGKRNERVGERKEGWGKWDCRLEGKEREKTENRGWERERKGEGGEK